MKLIYDDLLDKYYDENGNEVNGQPVVETHSFQSEFDAVDVIQEKFDLEEQQQKVATIEKAIANFKNQIKVLENSKLQITSKLLAEMQNRNMWQLKVGDVTISRVKASERHTLDTKRLKEEMPEIAKLYEQVTPVGESIRIKIGGTEND